MQDQIRIGDIILPSRVLLAPMCGYTDVDFRLIARSYGWRGLACSEMVDPKSVLLGKGRKREAIIQSDPRESPLCWQIYGCNSGLMTRAAQWLIENRGARMIDINMGCPQKKISRRGAGAGLLRNPPAALKLAADLAKMLPVPVTIKMRLGPDSNTSGVAASLAGEFEQAGVAAITVHARTLEQRYSGSADWNAIDEIARRVRGIPVIGNGDIASPETALSMMEQTSCAAIMIGRAALKRPWLLRDINCAMEGQPVPPSPTRSELADSMAIHLQAMLNRHGQRAGTLLFRRWIPQYAAALNMERTKMIELLKMNEARALLGKIQALKCSGLDYLSRPDTGGANLA